MQQVRAVVRGRSLQCIRWEAPILILYIRPQVRAVLVLGMCIWSCSDDASVRVWDAAYGACRAAPHAAPHCTMRIVRVGLAVLRV